MTKRPRVAASISNAYFQIEARLLARGFSVVIFDPERHRYHRLAKSPKLFSWQRFSDVLVNWGVHADSLLSRGADIDVGNLPEMGGWTFAAESSLVEDALRLCFQGGLQDPLATWFVHQSDASLRAVSEALADPLQDAGRETLEILVSEATELGLPADFIALHQHYGLGEPNLALLRGCVSDDMERLVRLRDARVEELRDKIDLLVSRLDDGRTGGFNPPSIRSRVRSFVESKVGRHGALPSGRHRIPPWGPEVDFDELRREHGV